MLRNFTFAAAMTIVMVSPVHADDQPALISFKIMTLETAQKLAQATLNDLSLIHISEPTRPY